MLRAKEKEDCLHSLVTEYIAEQKKNKEQQRKISSMYLLAKGKLLGFCTAYEWELLESINILQIRHKNGRLILEIRKEV